MMGTTISRQPQFQSCSLVEAMFVVTVSQQILQKKRNAGRHYYRSCVWTSNAVLQTGGFQVNPFMWRNHVLSKLFENCPPLFSRNYSLLSIVFFIGSAVVTPSCTSFLLAFGIFLFGEQRPFVVKLYKEKNPCFQKMLLGLFRLPPNKPTSSVFQYMPSCTWPTPRILLRRLLSDNNAYQHPEHRIYLYTPINISAPGLVMSVIPLSLGGLRNYSVLV